MRGLVATAVHNPVATNLLMVVLLVAGSWSVLRLNREVLPSLSRDTIRVSVQFDGATPEEVEEGVVIKVEEAVHGISGVGKVPSKAYEERGLVWVELERGANSRKVRDEIKDAVEKIDTFPVEAKEPHVVEVESLQRVINIVVYGAQSKRMLREQTLKEIANEFRDDLLATATISQVQISGARDYEIALEISEEALRRYSLTFDQVLDAVRRSNLALSAGQIQTPMQDIVVRTTEQRYTGLEFKSIPLVVHPDGAVIRLGDVASVIDGFADVERLIRFNGQPAVIVSVYKTDDEDALAIAETVRDYMTRQAAQLPKGLSLSIWDDTSEVITGRLQLLTNNGLMGLAMVVFCLWLFLNLRLAFWVGTGLLVALAGAFWLMEMHGSTLNMVTMFACIMALGMLVDDGIVVGENIYSHWRRGKHPVQAAIDGASEVSIPVIAATATSIAALMPLFLVEGQLGKLAAVVPIAIVAALVASLLESLIILPPHLAHALKVSDQPSRPPRRLAQRVRQRIDAALIWCAVRPYLILLRQALKLRLVVAAAALAALMIVIGLVLGGHLNFVLFPRTDTDALQARLTMPPGTPFDQTLAMTDRLDKAAWQLNQHFQAPDGGKVVQGTMTVIGAQSGSDPAVGSHGGQVTLALLPIERRSISSAVILAKWRELSGEIPDALALQFVTPDANPGGEAIEVQLIGDTFADLRQAADRLQEELASYPGVFDVQNDYRSGKMEMQLALNFGARVLGLTLADLGRQVRQGFLGAEVLRLQRGRHEVPVVIRYPSGERRALGDVENMRIRTPDGQEIPFGEVATVTPSQGSAVIKRVRRQRVITVTADVNTTVANAGQILSHLRAGFLPQLLASYDGIRLSLEGQQLETQRSVSSLYRGFIFALLLIYAILAIVFRSYVQPLIIMAIIPFGLVGAVLGHLIMGHDLTILSLFGFMALSGIVVNDSLVLLDYINRAVRGGTPIVEAVLLGGEARFRAIILTSLTTIAGLLPLLTEKSLQAQFLIPMAISISFGLMGATFLTLFLVPSFYLLLHDVCRIIRWLLSGDWTPYVKIGAASDAGTENVSEGILNGDGMYAKAHAKPHPDINGTIQ